MTTDDSKAALAAALYDVLAPSDHGSLAADHRRREYWEGRAAAILGERGVFWATGKDEYRELIRQREAAAVAARNAEIAAAVRGLPGIRPIGYPEAPAAIISRAAVLAIVEAP